MTYAELEEKYKELDFVPIIGDVRNPDRVDYVFRNWHPQVIFHAAAYKHVPLMEENPCELFVPTCLVPRSDSGCRRKLWCREIRDDQYG